MASSVNLAALESHLWEAANILRGPVDAADFKTYVFPLLFFKRISDVHDEEYQSALKESGGDEEYAQFPQNYHFQIAADAIECVLGLGPNDGWLKSSGEVRRALDTLLGPRS